jgi:hypothetical protein
MTWPFSSPNRKPTDYQTYKDGHECIHEVSKMPVIQTGWVYHRLGHLEDYKLAEPVYPGMVIPENTDISNEVDDIEILKDILPQCGIVQCDDPGLHERWRYRHSGRQCYWTMREFRVLPYSSLFNGTRGPE